MGEESSKEAERGKFPRPKINGPVSLRKNKKEPAEADSFKS